MAPDRRRVATIQALDAHLGTCESLPSAIARGHVVVAARGGFAACRHGSPRALFATRRIFAASLLVSCLVRLCRGDTWDIYLRLFKDANCYERFDELLLLDEACYANIWSNQSTEKAFSVKVVSFDAPQTLHIREYSDDCHTESPLTRVNGPKPILLNRCEWFIAGYWAMTSLRFRSTTCVGDTCSRLAVAVQTFYKEAECAGMSYATYKYPAPGCIRWANGTQLFSFAVPDGGVGIENITQTDFMVNDVCAGDLKKTYTMPSGHCFGLYEDRPPRSFKWELDQSARLAVGTAGAWRPQASQAITFALAFLSAAGVARFLRDGELLR
eukprot:TRINITY_DN67993_c0_g1_i1.p1 TRINITY_DN67993_c0_g1~~TRINITY_DN67993_c0_g1_i1.p1  ORF type:complete len:348 (-),score=44.32 TRINITY_DN67993_c0_g1_i1:30-1010(-)